MGFDALSFGLILPLLPRLILELSGGSSGDAARAVGVIAAIWAAMNFLAAPVLGVLSDRFGRRPVILISAFGFSADLAVMALAPSLGWLFLGRAISGVTAASNATAAAYIADITPPEQRAQRFGLFSATYGAGMILGPAVGGLIGAADPRAPFWLASAVALGGAFYGLFVLPESLPRERRGEVSWRAAIPVTSYGLLLRDKALAGLAGTSFLMQFAAQTANNIFVLYTAYRYGWSTRDVGLLLMFFSAGNMLVQAVIAPRLATTIGPWRTMFLGTALSAAGLIAGGSSATGLGFCLASVALCLGNMFGAALQALCTARVGPEEQGRLQGALSSQAAIATMAGPLIFTQVYAWSVSTPGAPGGPGLALICGGALMGCALLIGLWARRAA